MNKSWLEVNCAIPSRSCFIFCENAMFISVVPMPITRTKVGDDEWGQIVVLIHSLILPNYLCSAKQLPVYICDVNAGTVAKTATNT